MLLKDQVITHTCMLGALFGNTKKQLRDAGQLTGSEKMKSQKMFLRS